MQKQIKDFVKYISDIETPDDRSINIYHGNSYDAKLRRKNLLTYLLKFTESRPDIVLIGEAPGIHGCGRTGIPFTDEYAMATEAFFEDEGFHNLGLDRERSAAVIWNVLTKRETIPFMWNIYPFLPLATTCTSQDMGLPSASSSLSSGRPSASHRHNANGSAPLFSVHRPQRNDFPGNRTPIAAEIELGRDIFMELLFIFHFNRFYAIGRKAYDALKEVIPDITYIRHPAHGGIKECTDALNLILE